MEFGSWMQQFGWVFVLAGTFFEGEFTLLVGGYAAYHGHLSLLLVMLVAWVGSYLGDLVWFVAGRRRRRTPRNTQTWLGKRMDRLARAVASYPIATILLLRFQIAMRMFGCFTLGLSTIPRATFMHVNAWACGLWAVSISAFCFVLSPFWDWFWGAFAG